jgi:hypothetical protein
MIAVQVCGGASHEKVNAIHERLHLICPELNKRLQITREACKHMSLAEQLYMSPGALQKLKRLYSRHPNTLIVPTTVGTSHDGNTCRVIHWINLTISLITTLNSAYSQKVVDLFEDTFVGS